MKRNKIIYIALFAVLILSILMNLVIPSSNVFNLVFRIIGIIVSVGLTLFAFTKKQSVCKVIAFSILLSIVLSYLIPGTSLSYGVAQEGTVLAVPFADAFSNGITSISAFLTTFIYILFIGVLYGVINKTGKYDALVNNTAYKVKNNKGAFIVIAIFILGLVSMFTGEIYSMLVFVPFLISVIKKLGYSKPTAIVSTIGAILLGSAGSLYNLYINQMLNLTVNDNLISKVVVGLVGLVSLVAFVLIFGKKPESTKDLTKVEEKKVLPLKVTMIVLLLVLILGFVNWAGYFKFEGFDKFLETLRKGKIGELSIFDTFIGKSVVSFGNFEVYHAATLYAFVALVIALIYKIKFDEIIEGVADGLKKAFPYAAIVIFANVVLVNFYTSGVFYTIVIGLTKKSINILTGGLTGALAAFTYPDAGYAVQFSISALGTTEAIEYQNLFAVLFQAVYSVFLLISPTSILLLFGLRYAGVSYKEWIKYIYKYFIVLLVTVLVVVSLTINGFDAFGIVALILLVVGIGAIVYLKLSKPEAKKVEVKKEETTKKENITKKASVKKTTTKKTNKK